VELVIAEKPSVARDLARVLLARPSGKGAYEGGGRVITWCVGHLVELDEPAAYDGRWKAWRLDTLPMLPVEFKLRPAKHASDQLKRVMALLRDRRFTSVINACDAGREGELIFRYLLQYAGRTPPARRLWISSLTDDAIRRGFAALKPAAQFDALGDAARARSEADWLVGMNATRAVTVRQRDGGGDTLFSIGRVQTPTLAMLVAREQAIRSFVPRDYWETQARFTTAEGERFEARWTHGATTRLGAAALADALVERAQAHGAAADPLGPRVARLRSQTVREPPPPLFDLTSLQRTANRRFGMSAQRTLDLAQALYERHKLVTYPRTDSRHLTSDMAPELPKLWAGLGGVPEYAPFVARLQAAPPRVGRRVVDDAKVSDHHAIIPTGKAPDLERLDRDERRLFDLIARRFLGVFFADAEFDVTDVLVRVGPEAPLARAEASPGDDEPAIASALPPPPDWFAARGRVRRVAGWQEVAGIDDEPRGRGDDEAARLPALREGQPLDGTFAALAKQTQPPRRHTEATLLSAMESAGKTLSDEELRAAMKDNGLGTPATRANIIETLLQRGYARREQKQIVPTELGLALIAALPVPSLASPELTGAWEARLVRIARGQESRAAFMSDIARYVRETVDAIRASAPAPLDAAARPIVGRCPKCGGAVQVGARAFACAGGCGFSMRKNVAGRAIGDKLAAVLLARRRSEVLRGFRSKAGKRFAAALLLEDDGELRFDFARDGAAGAGEAAPGRTRTSKRPASTTRGDKSRSAATRSGTDSATRTRKSRAKTKERAAVAERAQPASPAPARPTKAPRRPTTPRAAARTKGDATAIAELVCPRCLRGKMIAGKRGWGCARWREGCGFVVWFETAGRALSEAQLRDLIVQGRTRRGRFAPDGGAPVAGRLVLDVDGASGARFVDEDGT
jgi:DNA topoisomerase-3